MENSTFFSDSFDCGQARTPLKTLSWNGSNVGSAKKVANSPFNKGDKAPGLFAVGGVDDRLQSRIEHLERERVELSLQLHIRDEKERSKNILIKSLEQAKEELEEAAKNAKRDAAFFRNQKESLDMEVGRLNAQLEIQKGKLASTEGLWAKMTAATREVRRVEDDNIAFKQEISRLNMELESQQRIIDANNHIITDIQSKLVDSERKREEFLQRCHELQQYCIELNALRVKYDESQQLIGQHEQKLLEQQQHMQTMQDTNATTQERLQQRLAELEESLQEARQSHSGVHGRLQDTESAKLIAELQEALALSDSKRRKLHNTLQELRGNIRVFVRCRPFLRGDDEGDNSISTTNTNLGSIVTAGCIKFGDDGSTVTIANEKRSGAENNFAFDHVFKPNTQQSDVFSEISEYVQSALDGYRICIFSYGQTGSGKTHTMTGGRDEASRGITPRSVEQIIKQVLRMRSQGWDVSLSASMVELYNEELRDLLCCGSTAVAASAAAGASKDNSKLKIMYQHGRVNVHGLTSVDIDSTDLATGLKMVQTVLDTAAKQRSTACTAMNDVSSRSHALFMLDIVCKHSDGVTTLRGGLRLCDLAGSERLDRTGTLTDAARLKETVNINKSLSCLADVFIALANKGPHIPYRNSKLTLLLQDCLSGDGKSLMIVNVSPTAASSQETICSLRFASQVSKVELGKAQKNVYVTAPAPALAPAAIPIVAQAAVTVAMAPSHMVMSASVSQQIANQSLAGPAAVTVQPINTHTAAPDADPTANNSRDAMSSRVHSSSRSSTAQGTPQMKSNHSRRSSMSGNLTQNSVTQALSFGVSSHRQSILPTNMALISQSIPAIGLSSANSTSCSTSSTFQTAVSSAPLQPAPAIIANSVTQSATTHSGVTSCIGGEFGSSSSSELTTSRESASSRVLSIAHTTGTSASALLQQYRAKRALLQAGAAGGVSVDGAGTAMLQSSAAIATTSSTTITTNPTAAIASAGYSSNTFNNSVSNLDACQQAAKRLRPSIATTASSAAANAARSWR